MQAHKMYFVFILLSLLVLIVPAQFLSPVATIVLQDKSILGADKTPPSSIKFTSIPPSFAQEKNVQVAGNAEAESKVSVFLNDTLVETLEVGDESKFSTQVALTTGDNRLWITIADRSGNIGETSEKLSIRFE